MLVGSCVNPIAGVCLLGITRIPETTFHHCTTEKKEQFEDRSSVKTPSWFVIQESVRLAAETSVIRSPIFEDDSNPAIDESSSMHPVTEVIPYWMIHSQEDQDRAVFAAGNLREGKW